VTILPTQAPTVAVPRQKAVDLARRTLALIEARGTDRADRVMELPIEPYRDADHFRHECDVLFRKGPVFAGFSAELPAPGRYKTIDLPGRPVILVRQADGTLRACVNACRHRGARLVDGTGSTEAFSCPYHAWCYGLDGRLVSTKAGVSFGVVDPEHTSLAGIDAAEEHGLMFIRGRTDAPDLRVLDVPTVLGEELTDQLRQFRFGGLGLVAWRTFECQANWKLVLDTQLETHHIATLHPTTLAMRHYSDHTTFDAFGPHGLIGLAHKSIGALAGVEEEDWEPIEHVQFTYGLFPNAVLHVASTHVEYVQVLPGPAPASARVVHAYFAPPGGRGPGDERHGERAERSFRTLVDEDARMAENVQQNITAAVVERILVGQNEPAVQHQYLTYDAMLQLEPEEMP
jgi:phenylpropionate dioxygenase-like ring-hydroxylating dioxygenase large terminal subunit